MAGFLSPEDLANISSLTAQQQPLEEQLKQTLALRGKPAQQFQGIGSGWGNGLAGLGHVIGEIGSHVKEGQIREQQAAIGNQLRPALQQLGQQGQPEMDFSKLLSDNEDEAKSSASALATALRGQREQGNAAIASGNPIAIQLGQHMLESADRGQKFIEQLPQERARVAQEHQQALLGNEKVEEMKKRALPASLAAQNFGKRIKLDVPANTTAGEFEKLVGPAERAYAADKSAEARSQMLALQNPETSPDAIEDAARYYLKTAKFAGPAGRNVKFQAAVRDRAAQIAREEGGRPDLAGNSADYQANTKSLSQLTTNTDNMEAFAKTADANLSLFLDQAKKLTDTGSPLLNLPVREFQRRIAGDPQLAGLDAALQVATNEIANVLSNPNGKGITSDASRAHAASLIGPNGTAGQMLQAATILRQDMANRKNSAHSQLSEIKGRIGGQPAQQQSPQQDTRPRSMSPSGKPIRWNGKSWEYEK